MTREQLLSLIGKGKQKYKDMQIEVSTSVWSAFNNAKTVHVTLYPVNRFSTPARFGGGFIDDVTEQDCAELDAALEKAVGQMRDAERRAASEPPASDAQRKRYARRRRQEALRLRAVRKPAFHRLCTEPQWRARLRCFPPDCPEWQAVQGRVFFLAWEDGVSVR